MPENAPTERELDVLKVLWELGEARVRDVHEAMCRTEECAFTTVQTLLRIMADKGLVKQRLVDRALLSPVAVVAARATSARSIHGCGGSVASSSKDQNGRSRRRW